VLKRQYDLATLGKVFLK
jgi:hypothetical protein